MDLPRGFSPPGILQGFIVGINPKLLKRYLQGKSALVVGDRSLGYFFFASAERSLLPVLLLSFSFCQKKKVLERQNDVRFW